MTFEYLKLVRKNLQSLTHRFSAMGMNKQRKNNDEKLEFMRVMHMHAYDLHRPCRHRTVTKNHDS